MGKFLERGACGRCAGSGKYSYNAIDGDRCYGCGGTGIVLTKRGKAAKAYLIELQMRAIEECKAGEFFWYEPWPSGKRGWYVLGEIKADELNAGRLQAEILRNGKSVCGYGFIAGQKVRSIRNQAHLDETLAAAEAYQATLGANGKAAKKRKVAA